MQKKKNSETMNYRKQYRVNKRLALNLSSLAALMLISLISFTNCGRQNYRQFDGMVWNTTYHIVYESEKRLDDSIMNTLKEVENSVSVFNENSIVSQVNSHKEYKVDSHFRKVYEMSRDINKKSGGAFDPTLSPLIEAWGFGKGHQPSADTLRIDSMLEFVGIEKTALVEDRMIKEHDKTQFNFSAIAKGYGVDCVAEMLKRNGVDNYLVEIGGEIRCGGLNQQQKEWIVSIDSPAEGNENLEHVSIIKIKLTDEGVATSGNYRNYQKTATGASYGHTISASTGRPVKTDVLSATVITKTAMLADALATTCMAIGSEKGLALCDSLQCGVMLVLDDLTVISNAQFKRLVTE